MTVVQRSGKFYLVVNPHLSPCSWQDIYFKMTDNEKQKADFLSFFFNQINKSITC